MIGLIVCTHGKFSEELVRSSEMMFGKQEKLQCLTFELGDSVDALMERYKESIKNLKTQDGILFLVDLFGGSPYNVASRIVANNDNMDIVTGVNLPMLLEVYGMRDCVKVDELVNTAICAGSGAVKSFKANFETMTEEEL